MFPISKVINVVFRARGARTDELPHSYQMMLFWAGLRGAVGVALAEGMKGEHAVALRTTVLVAVVLTVVVFGGTIQRMIEILGIRTGVEEDESDSEDEDGVYNLVSSDGADVESRRIKRRSLPLGVGAGGGGGVSATNHHFASQGNNRLSGSDYDPSTSPYRDQQPRRGSSSRLGAARVPSPRRPQVYVATDNSVSSDDSDPDVLPSPSDPLAAGPPGSSAQLLPGGGLGQVWSALDEQYLLPVFSNTTANRHERSKKMAARAKKSSIGVDRAGLEGDEEGAEGIYAGGSARNKSFSVSGPRIASGMFAHRSVAGHCDGARRSRALLLARPVAFRSSHARIRLPKLSLSFSRLDRRRRIVARLSANPSRPLIRLATAHADRICWLAWRSCRACSALWRSERLVDAGRGRVRAVERVKRRNRFATIATCGLACLIGLSPLLHSK